MGLHLRPVLRTFPASPVVALLPLRIFDLQDAALLRALSAADLRSRLQTLQSTFSADMAALSQRYDQAQNSINAALAAKADA